MPDLRFPFVGDWYPKRMICLTKETYTPGLVTGYLSVKIAPYVTNKEISKNISMPSNGLKKSP